MNFSVLHDQGASAESAIRAWEPVADRCGVREFQLEEITELGMFDQGTWSTTGAMTDAGPATDAPPDGGLTAAAMASAPSIEFSPYLVRAAFTADYAQTAAFLGGLARVGHDEGIEDRERAKHGLRATGRSQRDSVPR